MTSNDMTFVKAVPSSSIYSIFLNTIFFTKIHFSDISLIVCVHLLFLCVSVGI